VVIMNT
jgi:GINS complex subunit 2